MTKRVTRITALLASIIIIGGFILFQSNILSKKDKAPKKEAAAESDSPSEEGSMPAIPVKAMLIQEGALKDFISVNGSTTPNEEVTITSEVPGKIEKIYFTEGSWVKKGDLLVHLDDSELQAQRKRLVVQKELDEKIAERLGALYEKEGVSLQEYEVAKAEAEKVKADIALVDVQIEKRKIVAPFSGRLGLRQVSEGSYISPGDPVVDLVSINPIKLQFSVPEKYSTAIDRGTKVEFKLDGSESTYGATVVAAEPNIDPDTRTFQLKATASNPEGKILPGAFAKVWVNLKQYDGAIMVPTQAIVPELGGKKVFVFKNGTAQAVSIETGIRQESSIQVVDGLENGDTLITTGVLQIRPGVPVLITTLD